MSFAALAAFAGQAPAQADPLPYGPDTCVQGYVWREAIPSDHVCVTPAVRDRTQQENASAAERRDPTGAYGSNTCKQGFVWREAFDGDTVCVTPDIRSASKADNAAAASRVQSAKPQSNSVSTVVFEITGSGRAHNIMTDPAGAKIQDVPLPWSRTVTVGPDITMLQVVGVQLEGTGSMGCRITLDGKVVNEEPPGKGAHCAYERS